MTEHMPTLVMPEPVYAAIREIIAETREGLETGVTLFGARHDGARVALFAVGPGSRAIHRPGFHEPDADHINLEFERLREAHPSLEWIGSLHVHPFGMPWLSGHDLGTIRKLLTPSEALVLPDFIAGIIQRHNRRFVIHPYLFEARELVPWLVPIQVVAEDAEPVRAAREAAQHAPMCLGPQKIDLNAAFGQKRAKRVSSLRAFFSYPTWIFRKILRASRTERGNVTP